jgi:hypothetical protein
MESLGAVAYAAFAQAMFNQWPTDVNPGFTMLGWDGVSDQMKEAFEEAARAVIAQHGHQA